VYDGPALRETLRMVGRRFRREGIQTKLFLPEDIQWTDAMRNLLMPSLEDPEVRGYVDIVAVHGYAFDGRPAQLARCRHLAHHGGLGCPVRKARSG
jgi:glucuronoarabinoxylan endo-1,4-beta-xylanase